MENSIIITILILIIVIAFSSTIKHYASRGGCCGTASIKKKKKKLSKIIYTKTFFIEGMHCKHCKIRVEEIVNDIKGICGKVLLKKGILIISYAEIVDDEIIKNRIEKAGYTVTSII